MWLTPIQNHDNSAFTLVLEFSWVSNLQITHWSILRLSLQNGVTQFLTSHLNKTSSSQFCGSGYPGLMWGLSWGVMTVFAMVTYVTLSTEGHHWLNSNRDTHTHIPVCTHMHKAIFSGREQQSIIMQKNQKCVSRISAGLTYSNSWFFNLITFVCEKFSQIHM